MNRFARLIKIFVVILIIYALYLSRDRWVYERLLKSLYITLDDFADDYTSALIQLPDDSSMKRYNYSNYPDNTSEDTIPSIIHFIWFKDLYETHKDVTDIPSMGSEAPGLCRQYNPDFKVNIWNASEARDLLETYYPWFLDTYDSYIHPIQRVDAIKYFILHHFGGFYLDLDIACRRSLIPLQPFPAWTPKAQPLGVNNDALAFRKGHPAVEKMTMKLRGRNWNLFFPYLTIFWSTGPQFAGDILKSYLKEYHSAGHKPYAGADKYPSDPDEVYILPLEFYSEEYTFFGHSPGGTWHEEDVAVVLWLVAHAAFVSVVGSALVIGGVLFACKRWKGRTLAHTYAPVHAEDETDEAIQLGEKETSMSARPLILSLWRRLRVVVRHRAVAWGLSKYRRSILSPNRYDDDDDGL